MNATKRKFNTLLNGLGNKSTTSLSSTKDGMQSNNESGFGEESESQKRRRVRLQPPGASQSTLSSNQAANFPKSTIVTRSPAALQHKKSTSLAAPNLTQDTPKYAPWDREAFLQRLKTFSNLLDWSPKPARINEVEWAKRGWACKQKERVRCSLCNVEILVKLNKDEADRDESDVLVSQNIEEGLVDKYAELIIDSHEASCLWRKRGCDDSIFKLSLNHAPTTLELLRKRYDELNDRSATLPYMSNMKIPDGFDLDVVLSYLPKDFFAIRNIPTSTENTPGEVNRVAILMAIFGWQGYNHVRLGSQLGSASCDACFRVLGLWLFKSKTPDATGENEANDEMDSLDVVNAHREYCPWQNPASQNGSITSSALAGWEVLVRVLKNDHHLRTNGERQKTTPKVARHATPQKEGTPIIEEEEMDEAEVASMRSEDDKKRWARLRRVKSLFNTRSGKKIGQTDVSKSKASGA